MVEIDARKFGMPTVVIEKHATVGALSRQYWFHFLSLIAIVIFMAAGFSPTAAVFWTILAAIVFSFLHVDCALVPYDVLRGRPKQQSPERAVTARAHDDQPRALISGHALAGPRAVSKILGTVTAYSHDGNGAAAVEGCLL